MKLSRYTEVVANSVYTAPEVLVIPKKDPLILTKVVTFCQYDEPTKEGCIAYLQEKTKKVRGSSALVLPDSVKQEESMLEKLIQKFPERICTDIIQGNQECIEYVEEHCAAQSEKAGKKRYVLICVGYLTPEIESMHKHLSNDWYAAALSAPVFQKQGLGEYVRMQLLTQQGLLPPKQDMDVLLRNEATRSKTLVIMPKYHEDCAKIMESVYEGMKVPDDLRAIPDTSNDVLEERTIHTVLKSFFKVAEMPQEA